MVEVTHKGARAAAADVAGGAPARRQARFEELAYQVCVHFGVDLAELKSRLRPAEAVRARRVLVALCRAHTELSFLEIAARMSGPGISHTQTIERLRAFAADLATLGPVAWQIEKRLGLRQGGAMHAAMRSIKQASSRRDAEVPRKTGNPEPAQGWPLCRAGA